MGTTRMKQCGGGKRSTRDQALIDRLSNLSDDLLINILSFLPLRQAARTCTLSKRWRLLWTYLPTLNLDSPIPRPSIPGILIHHNPSRIIDFCYVSFSRLARSGKLESYLSIAVNHGIRVLKLDFYRDFYGRQHPDYKLPGCIFYCDSLTKLHLSYCALDLPESMHLNSLKSLTLEYMELADDTVERLTSSSPVLSELSLFGCNNSDRLRICIDNPSVKTLLFHDSRCFSAVNLCIPHVLHIKVSRLRLKYFVTGAAPSTCVEFLLDDHIGTCCSYHPHHSALFDLLNGVHCSKVSFNFPLTQFFSVEEMALFGKDAPTTRVHHMRLETGLCKFDVPGFVHLFKTFPDLETLDLTVQVKEMCSDLFGKPWYDKDDCKGNEWLAWKSLLEPKLYEDSPYLFSENECWESMGQFLSAGRPCLKTLVLNGFSRAKYVYEGVEDFLQVHKREIELLRVVIRNSSALQVVRVNLRPMHIRNRPKKVMFIQALTSTLSCFFKSSPSTKQISTERLLFSI